MFGRDKLQAVGEYATALLAAGLRQTTWPPAIARRWEPYHRLLAPEQGGAGRGRLLPIYADIGAGSNDLVMPRMPLALTKEALFPQTPTEVAPQHDLWAGAEPALASAVEQGQATPPDLAHYALEPIASCLQRFGANLPGTLGGNTVSLGQQFALAVALYAASSATEPAPAYTLIGSDTPGIQRFISAGTTSKGVAKRLRGRSAFLQLVTDAVAQRLLDALQLPRVNLLYAAGGNLLLLAPAGVDDTLRAVRHDLSRMLLTWSGGELDQALAWAPLAAGDLARDTRPALARLRAKLAVARRQPYSELLADRATAAYDQLFQPLPGGEQRLSFAAAAEQDEAEDDREAPIGDYGDLAEALARAAADQPAFLHRRRRVLPANAPQWQHALHALSGGWCYEFKRQPRSVEAPADHLVDALNRPDLAPQQATGFRFLATSTPRVADGSIRDLSSIAAVTPMNRIGVLRLDVDGLGAIFGQGLRRPTLANICTLSASLDRFFAGWLNRLCQEVAGRRDLAGSAPDPAKRGDLLYTIYSGGDDLFVVGAWDRLPVLADAIRRDFAAYCGQNPALHVSAGIAIDDAHFPLYQLAERAAVALDAAKDLRARRGDREKNALTLLGVVLPWERYTPVAELVARLTQTASEPSAVLGRLRDLALLDRDERLRLGLPPPDPFGAGPTIVGRAKWRGLVALQRAADQGDEALRRVLAEFQRGLLDDTLTPYLALVARWADYLWRKSGTQEEGNG